jgi:hypothetical protein
MSRAIASNAENPADDLSFDTGGLDDKRRAEKIMAEFAAAFSLEMDFDRNAVSVNDEKWPAGWTIAFSLAASAALWALLTAVFYFI